MSDRNDPKKIDLLDAALSAYGQVAPRPGLEARILGRIEENARRRRFVFRGLVVATAGATGLGLLLLVISRDHVPVHESTIASRPKVEQEIVPARQPEVALAPKEAIARIKVTAASVVSRQATFPAPSEPSDQERALAFLMQSRQEVLVALSRSRPPEAGAEMDIPPIKLDPLPGGGFESPEVRNQ